jgi:hypothetical protein
MKIHDDDLLLVMRALYWYQDKLANRQYTKGDDDWIELENIEFLRRTITEFIKERSYML